MSAAHYGQISILKMLLNEGAEVNARTTEKKTALHHAAIGGHAEAAQALLNQGADVDSKDAEHNTALIFAASFGHRETLETLLENGADINAASKVGETALGMAAYKCYTDVFFTLLYRGADIHAKNLQDITILMKSAWSGCAEIVRALLDHGADVSASSKNAETAIKLATVNGQTEIVKLLKQAEKVTSKSPLQEFLNQYLSWFRHPGAKSIEPQAIASDAISTWSDGRVLRGREEHIREMKQGMKEIREAFQLFKITAHDIAFELDGDMGLISCRLHREGILKKGGGKFSKDGRTTLKLKRNGDIWQLVEELSTLDNP